MLHALLAVMVASAPADAYAHPGQRVSVNGHRLNLVCEGTGRPVVVLDAGLGDWSPSWINIQRRIAERATVCSYDRAGYGFSDAATSPRTAFANARDLHALLHAANLPAPYVLAGHSFGGLDVQAFTELYRNDVRAVVLVDGTAPDVAIPAPVQSLMDAQAAAMQRCADKPVARGCFAMLWGISSQPDSGVTPRLLAAVKAQSRTPAPYEAVVSELQHLTQSQREVLRAERPLGDLPLVVLTATSHGEEQMPPTLRAALQGFEPAWRRAHQRIAALSTRGRYVLVRSGHYIQFDRPQVVIDALDEVLAAPHVPRT